MKRIHWESLAGNILYCDFLQIEQNKIYNYISDMFLHTNNHFGIIDIKINENLINDGIVFIEYIKYININGQYIEFTNTDYELKININEMLGGNIYICNTNELFMSTDNILTKYKESVNMPTYQTKLILSTQQISNSMLLCTISRNEYNGFVYTLNNSLRYIENLQINELCRNIYKYCEYVKINEPLKLIYLNIIYSKAINLINKNVYNIYIDLYEIYSILSGFENEIINTVNYNHNYNIQICQTLIQNINLLINKQMKTNMTLFIKDGDMWYAKTTKNIFKLHIIIFPYTDLAREWAIENMRIATRSLFKQVKHLRNIGIERSLISTSGNFITIDLNINSEWLILGEDICIEMPINENVVIQNISLKME